MGKFHLPDGSRGRIVLLRYSRGRCGRAGKREFLGCNGHDLICTGFAASRPTNSPTPLTRLSPYHGDKLSRPAPSSELIKWRPPCKIRSLTEGWRMAPILPGL